MNDIYVTLTGNVAAPPRQHTFPDGSRVTSLRVASTSRHFDRENQQWRDGETTYFGVRCFRGLADNVAQSVRVGQPVVVQGRLRVREFVHEGERRFMAEVEASSLGHDLRWGIGVFSKPQRGGAVPALGQDERNELDRETHDWALGGAAPGALWSADARQPSAAAIGDGASRRATAAVVGEETGIGEGPDGEADTQDRAEADREETGSAETGGEVVAWAGKDDAPWPADTRVAA
ncbi:hypothetical protein GCM10010156_57850 [Planobispora rosea]|uniref:Single-stranded DNA-binding protein n=1 Tax=Planobispora rosea TaxID=35762 RepID=A0A8J3SC68_PLARO|nr:single-stranded DNA-binding protein [Planobispora rosea]GGS92000.1 hypothetical protein GCM10010156_57850 [Planobispora rosea]GIH87088.1 hypothetical protein Pro02_54960 [Planobispora rosea]